MSVGRIMVRKNTEYIYACTFLTICCWLVCICAGSAQSLNALKIRLQNSSADTARLSTLLQLGNYYNTLPATSGGNQALVYAGNAEKLSIKLKDNRGLGNSYTLMAYTWRNKKDSTQAKGYLKRAKAVFVSNHLFREAAEVTLNMEEFYQYFGGTDFKVRIAYYEQALQLFRQSPARDREEATLKVLGDFYQVIGNNPKSLQYLMQAQRLSANIKPVDKEGLYDLLGIVNMAMGNLDKALEYGLLAVKVTEQSKDTTMQACAVYNRVGITYFQARRLQQSMLFFQRSLAIAVKCKDVQTQISEYVNICRVMLTQNEYTQCIALVNDINKRIAVDELSQQWGFDHILLKCYISLRKFKEAKIYAERMERWADKTAPLNNEQQIIQTSLTEYFVATVQDKPARQHINNIKKIGMAELSPMVMAIAYNLEAKLDSAENRFAASYRVFKKAEQLKDRVWNERQSKQVSLMQVQFDVEKKDHELKAKAEHIKLLNNQAELQRINLKQEKNTQKLMIGGALLLIMLLTISFVGYRA